MGRTDTKMVPLHDNHFEQVLFSHTVATSGICTGRYVLLPDVQPSVIVKAGALITVAKTRDRKLDRIYKIVIISILCCYVEHLNEHNDI